MIHKLLKQHFADTLMLVVGINADGIQSGLPGNAIFSYQEIPHDKPHHRTVFFLGEPANMGTPIGEIQTNSSNSS